jgi:hypothetical protein
MAEKPLAEYQEALRVHERAEREAERIVGIIMDIATRLRNWKQVHVSNVGVNFPVEVTATRSPEINGNAWPTARQLAEALSQYHSTLHEVGNAYRRIPENQRGVVQPPPES